MHGIKVLTAKNYVDNLSEEARKGQREKAEQGNFLIANCTWRQGVLAAEFKEPLPGSMELLLV
jgi:hypothetical protein